jgi:hypothetical protein
MGTWCREVKIKQRNKKTKRNVLDFLESSNTWYRYEDDNNSTMH